MPSRIPFDELANMEQNTNNKRKLEDTFPDFLYDNLDAKKQATEEELTL